MNPALLAPLLLLVTPQAHAQDLCGSPQAAARSLLEPLQHDDVEAAGACVDPPVEMAGRGPQLAAQLVALLEERGLALHPDELPEDPAWQNDKGVARLTPFPDLPQVALVGHGGHWRWSQDTFRALPALYRESHAGLSWSFQSVLPPWFFRTWMGWYHWQAAWLGVLLAASVAAGRLAQRLITSEFVRLARHLGIVEEAATWAGTRNPVLLATISGVLFWGIRDLGLAPRTEAVLLFLDQVVLSVSFVFIAYRAVGVLERIAADWARKTTSRTDDQLIPLLARMGRAAVLILGVLFVLQNQGVDIGSLLTGLGLGGLAVALAAKDTVENLFGSVTIFFDRPFQVGDWVLIGKETEGVVEEVGMRSTRVRTFSKSLVTVPNGKVAVSTIDNMGQRPVRRVRTTLGLAWTTPPDRIQALVERLRQIVRDHPRSWKESCEIHFTEFSPSSLDILVYFFVQVDNWHDELVARQEIFLAFLRAGQDLGVQFALPSTSLYVEKVPPPP